MKANPDNNPSTVSGLQRLLMGNSGIPTVSRQKCRDLVLPGNPAKYPAKMAGSGVQGRLVSVNRDMNRDIMSRFQATLRNGLFEDYCG